MVNRLKLRLALGAAGYFAYTQGSCDYLLARGMDPGRLFRLNNTLDIAGERDRFRERKLRRDVLRRALGLADERVLLFVGRLEKRKRLGFLAAAFAELQRTDPRYRLLIVGTGNRKLLDVFDAEIRGGAVRHLGSLAAPALADAFVASDLYVMPGWVGLGPLHALCFDLIPAVVDGPTHAPEYEYLTPHNSVICPSGCAPVRYAATIHAAFTDPEELARRRRNAWRSIEHLTIDAMAKNFIAGVNCLLETSAGQG